MNLMQHALKRIKTITVPQKLRPFVTRRNGCIAAVAVVMLSVAIFAVVHGQNRQDTMVVKPAASHKSQAKDPAATEAATTAQADVDQPDTSAATTDENTTAQRSAPKQSAPKSAPAVAPAPTPKPQPETIDFTLSPSAVTLKANADAVAIRGISSTGKPLEWAYMGGSGIFATYGITSSGAVAVHEFGIKPSPDLVSPGTYQVNVMGYIPGGQKVVRQLTVTIIAP